MRDNVWKAVRKRKSWTPLNFYAYAWPFIHCLHFIYACEFYVRSHGKVTRQWKSTLNNHFGEKKSLWSASAKGALSPVLNGNCAYFCNHYIRQCYFVDTKITLKVDFQIHLHNDSLRNELCPRTSCPITVKCPMTDSAIYVVYWPSMRSRWRKLILANITFVSVNKNTKTNEANIQLARSIM